MKCKFHDVEHPPKIIDDFVAQCQRLGIKIPPGDCPIRILMEETPQQLAVLEPEFTLINQPISAAKNWPFNIDLLITKFPTTEKDGFSKGLAGLVANQAYQYLNSNALLFLMVSSFKEEKTRPFDLVNIFVSAGFKFIDTIVWVKNKFIPTQGSKRLNNIYDFVFMFARGDNYHLDRPSIAFLKNRLDLESDEEYLCPGNVWKIKVDDKDATPAELIDCLIKLANLLPNSKIVDPFMDTGATLKAAVRHGHSFWGCEEDKDNFNKCKRLVRDRKNLDE